MKLKLKPEPEPEPGLCDGSGSSQIPRLRLRNPAETTPTQLRQIKQFIIWGKIVIREYRHRYNSMCISQSSYRGEIFEFRRVESN